MPLFAISKSKLDPIAQSNFLAEKELQRLIESNLDTVFRCRFVAAEFPTGAQHAGRIDTLALSEDGSPVIIEYKKIESSDLINQSLYYLSWIHDHRGDFEIAVQKAFRRPTEVDWSDVRVICIAPNYKKFDLHAVQVMGANIELWTYRLFANSTFYLEEVLQKSFVGPSQAVAPGMKNPIMVAAGKKAAIARATGSYTFEGHLSDVPKPIQDIAIGVQEFVRGLDSSIEEAPKKFYVAYRTSQNIVCMEIKKGKVVLFLKLNPAKDKGPTGISRDVREIGHYGTGDLELTLRTQPDFEAAKPFIEKAYRQIGG
jgi:predicted transport protein